ncbi:YecA family protein [Roseateles chitinivorans]|uniref:YecA family protein n=1 Tax=Roseateles chitinivorans TaxID=2917965 RepID=UPI003D67F36D
MLEAPRTEAQILEDLTALTASPGYPHAIAHICHRDTIIKYSGQLQPADMEGMFGHDRLIRTEVNTLLGLMVKAPLVLDEHAREVLKFYVERTDALMEELHRAMSHPMWATIVSAAAGKSAAAEPDIWQGAMLREPIFYGGESAYAFQYRDLLPEKYGADDAWLLENKGFTSTQGRAIAHAMCKLMDDKSTALFAEARRAGTEPSTWLPVFELSASEVAHRSGVARPAVDAFLTTFLFSGHNENFKELGDFSALAATPLLPTDRGTFLLFQHYAIYEALYESPFFWMLADKAYWPTAKDNRGAFIEQYSSRRLAAVFGREHVHSNVNLHRGKAIVGEADVLVAFADRLIIVQCKAKKLTIEARKGNDGQLKKDFAGAIQDSYDQGWKCANELMTGGCRLVDASGTEVRLPATIKEIHLFSVVAEHYPALAFQARQFLKYQTTDVIRAPFIMDVFLLDTMTEMLATPLRLLSYAQLRTSAIEEITLSHELTALAYHLRMNLWLSGEYDMVHLDDSINVDLDVAMTVRRENMPGERTPPGILTRMVGTHFERLVAAIEDRAEPATLELGLALLAISEDSAGTINRGIESLIRQTRFDGKRHDFTLSTDGAKGGFTFHCSRTSDAASIASLDDYCRRRKYAQRAPQWFGVSIDADGDVQFGITLDFPWEQSAEMDRATAGMNKPQRASELLPQMVSAARGLKVGRNAPCPCGSGRKYKKCCLT